MSKQIQTIWVPPTTAKTIVFPWDEESEAFYTTFYEPEMTNEKVSLQEINQFISDVNVELKLFKKKKGSKEGWFMLIFLTLLLDLFIYLGHFRDNSFDPFTNGETIILTWFLSYLINKFFCPHCFWQPDTDFESHMRQKFQDMLDKENEILRSRELKWHLPDKFPNWIELTKDMKKNNSDWEIPYSVPQTTETTIIFPYQRYIPKKKQLYSTWRFTQDCFSPDMVNGKISYQEVQELLSELNLHLRTPLQRYPKMPLVFLCLSFELFGLLFISNHFSDLLTTFQTWMIVVISVVAAFYLWFRELVKEWKKRANHVKVGSQNIVDSHNEILQNRGLKWQLPARFPIWIELCKISHESVQLQDIPLNKRSDPLTASSQDEAEAHKQNDMYAPLIEDEN